MQKISRRDFGKRAAGAAACLALPTAILAQSPAAEPDPIVSDAEVEDIQKKLAKPLNDDARKILRADLVSQKKDTAARLKVSLPEQSEPCFIFVATPKRDQQS